MILALIAATSRVRVSDIGQGRLPGVLPAVLGAEVDTLALRGAMRGAQGTIAGTPPGGEIALKFSRRTAAGRVALAAALARATDNRRATARQSHRFTGHLRASSWKTWQLPQ
jgi:hypothetical protein